MSEVIIGQHHHKEIYAISYTIGVTVVPGVELRVGQATPPAELLGESADPTKAILPRPPSQGEVPGDA